MLRLKLIHFTAPWAPTNAEVETLLGDLLKEYSSVIADFGAASIDAEAVAEASLEHGVTVVPTLVLFKDGKAADRVDNVRAADVRTLILKHSFATSAAAANKDETPGVNDAPIASAAESHSGNKKMDEPTSDNKLTLALENRLRRLVNTHRLMLFMKGNADAPRCGFSRQIVELLRSVDADFATFDILTDEEVRQALKIFSDWPTYPQLYLDGELLGGIDVVREEFKSADFVENLPKKKLD